jgi:hypothetical protein
MRVRGECVSSYTLGLFVSVDVCFGRASRGKPKRHHAITIRVRACAANGEYVAAARHA